MRIAVLADIGHPTEHVGDDAIAIATFNELTNRGITPVMLTHNEEESRRLLPDAEFYPTPTFSGNPTEQLAQFNEGRRDENSKLHRLVTELLSDVEGVVIAGGGSLNSYYAWLAFERASLAIQAHEAGKPVVLTGHSFGPLITKKCEPVFAEMAASLDVAGFRGPLSVELARQYGFQDAVVTCDDATRMAAINIPDDGAKPFIAGCFSSPIAPWLHDQCISLYASILDYLSQKLDLPVRLIPHMANPDAEDQDLAFHAAIADACIQPCEISTLAGPEETIRGFAGAKLTVTSRFHQAVFSCMQEVPVLPLAADLYGVHRMGDLLENHGLDPSWVLPVMTLQGSNHDVLLDAFVARMQVQQAQLTSSAPAILDHHQKWWDSIATGFKTGDFKVEPLAIPNLVDAPSNFVEALSFSRPYLTLMDEKIRSDLKVSGLKTELLASKEENLTDKETIREIKEKSEQEKNEIINQYEARKAIRIANALAGKIHTVKNLFASDTAQNSSD